MSNRSEDDYKARHIKGGSPKGRDQRRCPDVLKYFSWTWAIKVLGDGNESNLIHNPNSSKGRFTEKAYKPLIPILLKRFPEECEKYFDGRMEKAARLIMHRVHKIFYSNDGKTRTRAISREHPKYWKELRLANVLKRIAETE